MAWYLAGEKLYIYAAFEVLAAVIIRRGGASVFWDISPCIPLEVVRRFGGTYDLHVQGRKVNQARNQHEAGSSSACYLRSVSVLAWLILRT
jgi:hypothetical protein